MLSAPKRREYGGKGIGTARYGRLLPSCTPLSIHTRASCEHLDANVSAHRGQLLRVQQSQKLPPSMPTAFITNQISILAPTDPSHYCAPPFETQIVATIFDNDPSPYGSSFQFGTCPFANDHPVFAYATENSFSKYGLTK